MKCASILPLAIVLAATCAIGQDSAQKTDPQQTPSAQPHFRWAGPGPAPQDWNSAGGRVLLANPMGFVLDAANCPVGLEVDRSPGLAVGRYAEGPVGNEEVLPPAHYQRLRLTMTNPASREIVSAEMTAHGFSDKWRIIPLSGAEPDLSKVVDIGLDVKGQGRASRDLALSQFTAVTAIDLDSVTYADGSTWQAPSPGACSVTPSMLMLVSDIR